MFKGVTIAVVAIMLASCGAPKPRPSAQPGGPRSEVPEIAAGARVYRIDAAQSELRVLVYRAGPLARLGHNHVMVNRALAGSVRLGAPGAESSFSLSIPVAAFLVDDTQSRSEEGADFAGEVPDDAKSGTLHNMLGAALLDAAEFPEITVQSIGVADTHAESTATLTITVAGHESKIEAPYTLESDGHRLSAGGSLDLRQTDIGLTPFSLMLGALQVRDTVRLKFKIVAVAG